MNDQEIAYEGRSKLGDRLKSAWQWLRTATSCLCISLCVVVVLLWVRSYFSMGICVVEISDAHYCSITSWRGRVSLQRITSPDSFPGGSIGVTFIASNNFSEPTQKNGWTIYENKKSGKVLSRPPGFYYYRLGMKRWGASIPHWFLVVLSLVTAVFIRPKPRLTLSLRELLLTVSFVSLALGAIEAST